MIGMLEASTLLAGGAIAELTALGAWILYQRLRGSSNDALTDPLTGLRNRRYLTQTIELDVAQSLRRYRKPKKTPTDADLVFFFVDIDRFKSVNDDYGHAAGDRVLVEVANVLRAATRDSDVVVRWGGEEFVIVERFSSREDAAASAERIRHAVASHSVELSNGRRLSVTCSIGFAAFPLEPREAKAVSWEDVLTMADLACYDAKARGRNRCAGPRALHGNLRLVRDEEDERPTWRAHRARLSYSPTTGPA